MKRETPNFTYEQDLACPVCGGMLQKLYMCDRKGRYKQYKSTVRRPESKGPWAKDDVLEDITENVNAYSRRKKGRQWVHSCEFMCSKCGVTLSRAQGKPHEFTDDELPYNFWEKPDGEYIPLEEPQPVRPATMNDIYNLDSIF